MKVEVTVCNVCQEVGKSTQPYAIENTDRRVDLDLCEEHATPLEELLPLPRRARAERTRKTVPKKAQSPPARPRRSATPIMTMEEIEQRKAASKAGKRTRVNH